MRDDMGMPLPTEIGGRQVKFDAAPELLEQGHWVCLNIDISCPWPVRPQSLEFAGHRIWIIPLTLEEYPGVALRCPPGTSQEDAAGLLYRFLSVLSWQNNCGISVVHQTGGGMPHMVGLNQKRGFCIRNAFDFTEVICPVEEGPRLALALMREARSLNHYGYSFLTFWRVLELAFPVPKERVAWMTVALPTLSGLGVKEALESIAAQGMTDVGLHLFESGRCAVSHGAGKPIINPDDPRDARRLYRELPLVREMAVRAVEERFGILTSSTEYRQHLYELRGWKEVLGPDLIGRLLKQQRIGPDEMVDLPNINVRLRENRPYGPMEGMTAADARILGGRVHLTYQSSDRRFEIRFALDLGEERLVFDVTQGLFGHDDGSVAAAEHCEETQRFFRDYLLNGEFQIWNAQNGALLSRKDAFMPVNCFVDLDACNANIAAAHAEVERRQSTDVEVAVDA